MENSVECSLLEEQGNPRRSYVALGRILSDMGVDKILASFPVERRDEISEMPPQQIAAEFIEDTALQWAGNRFKSSADNPGKLVIDDDVVRVLARSLQATQNAARLAKKLTKFIEDYAIPPHIREKIQDELRWTALSGPARHKHLMEIRHYSSIEFRHLIEFLKELVTLRKFDQAGELAIHYFDFLDDDVLEIEIAELSRAPEVIRSIPLGHIDFVPIVIEKLTRTLVREDVTELVHFQAANALSVLSQSIAGFEDFEHVLQIGSALDRSQKREPARHKKCCIAGLSRLLPEIGIERVIELFLLQPDDAAWAKNATNLLRFSAPASVEKVFIRLIEEKDTRKRLAVLRLITQLRAEAVEVAVRYMEDDRWFVVRNMCSVLAELEDPPTGNPYSFGAAASGCSRAGSRFQGFDQKPRFHRPGKGDGRCAVEAGSGHTRPCPRRVVVFERSGLHSQPGEIHPRRSEQSDDFEKSGTSAGQYSGRRKSGGAGKYFSSEDFEPRNPAGGAVCHRQPLLTALPQVSRGV